MKWISKLIISLVISFIILNVVTFVYYNVPLRSEVKDEVTEYKWPADSFYSRFTEGIAWGKTNNDGYNNLFDYDPNKKINNILMGSSHAEGFNIAQNENIASRLNELTNTYTYNIGISEHTLPICLSNLENVIQKYKPSDYVIIETMTISFYDQQINDSLNDNVHLNTISNRYIDFLQNFKYLKLVYSQLDNLSANTNVASQMQAVTNSELLNKMFVKAKETCDKNGVKLIIVFHPTLSIYSKNNVTSNYNIEDMGVFEDACKQNGIIFVNMENDFINNYYSTYELPHGFINTKPGEGHLNRIGHELIAIRLKEEMEK